MHRQLFCCCFLPLWRLPIEALKGETVNVSSDDGEGWYFGYFLDPEDPDDGGWFPYDCICFLDTTDQQWDEEGRSEGIAERDI